MFLFSQGTIIPNDLDVGDAVIVVAVPELAEWDVCDHSLFVIVEDGTATVWTCEKAIPADGDIGVWLNLALSSA